MNIKLQYFDDKKEKSQSHEVSISFDGIYIAGYGASKKDAYDELIREFDELIEEIVEVRGNISLEKI